MLLGVAVVCLGGAAFFTWRGTRDEEGASRPPAFWVCMDCKHEFTMDGDEVVGNPDVDCPKCSSRNIIRGLPCSNCQRIFVRQGRGQPVCPYCNKPLPTRTAVEGG